MDLKNSSIRDTFNVKLKMPWVWLVIVLTVGLTVLFYLSQKPQILMYSKYIKSLSEFQLAESRLMRSMERVRSGSGIDAYLVESQLMTLREMAVAFSREMDELRSLGVDAPSFKVTSRFEGEVLSKTAAMRRYLPLRNQWINKISRESHSVASLPAEDGHAIEKILDSARAGFVVSRPLSVPLSDSLAKTLDELLSENADLSDAWSKFDNEIALLRSEDMIQFFQAESLDEMALKSKVPMVFYFLSLVLLLSTFFFLFKSRL